MKAAYFFALVFFVGAVSATKFNITVICKPCTITCGHANCYHLTSQSFISLTSYDEEVCGSQSCNLSTNYNLEVDRCSVSGLGKSCDTSVCTYPEVQNACASQIGYTDITKCAAAIVQVNCGSSCSGVSCGQCIKRSDAPELTCFDNCSNFENKNITITPCVTTVDYTGNSCNCCMKVNPAHKLGICTSSSPLFGSNKFTVYALARSILFQKAVLLSAFLLVVLLGLFF